MTNMNKDVELVVRMKTGSAWSTYVSDPDAAGNVAASMAFDPMIFSIEMVIYGEVELRKMLVGPVGKLVEQEFDADET